MEEEQKKKNSLKLQAIEIAVKKFNPNASEDSYKIEDNGKAGKLIITKMSFFIMIS